MSGEENNGINSYLKLIWKIECNYIRYSGFIDAEMLFNYTRIGLYFSVDFGAWSCAGSVYHCLPKPLLLRGLNTYWHISHMQAKNRNHSHSLIISPSLSSTSPPSYYLPLLDTSLFFSLLLTPSSPSHSTTLTACKPSRTRWYETKSTHDKVWFSFFFF